VAMQTEFQLLNARLSDKAQNLELAEEQIWRIFADYQGVAYDGEITYPGSFNIRDETTEFEHLKMARDTATDPAVLRVIDQQLILALGEEYQLPVQDTQGEHPSLSTSTQQDRLSHIQTMLMEGYSNEEIVALHPEVTEQDIIDAGAAAAASN